MTPSEVKARENSHRPMRQVMDWQAAFGAGLVAGATSLLVLLIAYPVATGGTPWTVLRYIAAIVLGSSVLPPPTTFHALATLTGVVIHLVLSVIYVTVLALIIHRWGIIVGLLGGALFGLALFLINLFTFANVFEWFYPLRSWPFLLFHLFFGALAGGLYEWWERDYYVENPDAL